MIAIVDDDPAVLNSLARLLKTRSFAAQTYQSGRQFLDSLSDGKPDCLILDLQMPEMTGFEVQEHLVSRGIRIPTVIISARDDTEARERCRSAGALVYLPKPLDVSALIAAVNKAGSSGNRNH